MPSAGLTRVVATVFEPVSKLSEETIQNAQWIKCCGGHILYDIDATKLDSAFPKQKFDTIIFQFPNVGSRESKYGHTSNHVMVRKLLRAAKLCLDMHGKVLLTLVDNPHYRGIFKQMRRQSLLDIKRLIVIHLTHQNLEDTLTPIQMMMIARRRIITVL